MNTYFVEWIDEGFRGALIIANSEDDALEMLYSQGIPRTVEISRLVNQTERGAQIWFLGELS